VGIKDVEAFIAYQKGMTSFRQAHDTDDIIPVLVEANQWFDIALASAPALPNVYYLHQDMFGHMLFNDANNINSDYTQAELENALTQIRRDLDHAVQYARTDTQKAIYNAEKKIFEQDWNGMRHSLDLAFKPDDCTPLNWIQNITAVFDWADQTVQRSRNIMRCDPMSTLTGWKLPSALIWAGKPAEAVTVAEQALEKFGFSPWVDDALFQALLALDPQSDNSRLTARNPEGSLLSMPRKVRTLAARGETEAAIQLFTAWDADGTAGHSTRVIYAAMTGQRRLANEAAARIDSNFFGTLVILNLLTDCFCGAPFDLEVTPIFKQRIEEAGLTWPPPSPIHFPAKDW
jgi:adenylate cyclase